MFPQAANVRMSASPVLFSVSVNQVFVWFSSLYNDFFALTHRSTASMRVKDDAPFCVQLWHLPDSS